MTALALDVGARVGWARSDGDCGTACFRHCGDIGALCDAFHDWLCDQITEHAPRVLVLERPFGRAAFTADLPVVLCGIAHMVAHRREIARRELTASAIKKAVAGTGRASKADVIAAVSLDGWSPDTDHAADACALLMAWRQREAEDATCRPPARLREDQIVRTET
jgi:Holliday junction resolvasome RuvABC endonuclease subunit